MLCLARKIIGSFALYTELKMYLCRTLCSEEGRILASFIFVRLIINVSCSINTQSGAFHFAERPSI